MNLNYIGSVAERFMKFRSRLASTGEVASNLFNAISIYVPKSLAVANLESGSYTPSTVTSTSYAVIIVTVDNYRTVLKGNLLTQWQPVFNDDTNTDITMYIIVFDDTTFAPVVTDRSITWAPLTQAFNELFFISLFKTMFSEHYDGATVSHEPAQSGDYDDSNYFDMVLALSALCEAESSLSVCLAEIKVAVPETASTTDSNACKILSQTRATEVTQCSTLTGSTEATRAQYFWGYLNLIGGSHTMCVVNNGAYMIPIILGKWFEEKNVSGEYVGNKLAKIRLSNSLVKPTGLPSKLDGSVNLNLIKAFSDNLDDKNVGYFISIADGSLNNAELIRDRSISNFPVTAYMIAKWIDYNASQDMAKFVTDESTLTKPVLANAQAYQDLQALLVAKIQKFAGLGRLENVKINFPPFSEAKVGNTFRGTAVWSAVYIDDLEGVEVSGSITF